MKHASISVRFLVSLGCLGAAMIGVGLWFLYSQEQERLMNLLETEGQIIQAQVEETRAYIAKNYVGKIKQSSVGEAITIAREHAFDPNAIPFPATATREIGEALGKRRVFRARLISDNPLNPDNAPKSEFERMAVQAIMSGADVYSMIDTSGGEPVFRRASADKASVQACVNCHVGKQVGDVVGLLSLSIPMGQAQAGMWMALQRTGGLLVAVIVASLAIVYVLLQRFVLSPLNHLTLMAKDIAHGEGDLTKRVPITRDDEIGTLARYFNVFIDKIQHMIAHVAEATNQLASASAELSATAEELAKGSEDQNSRMLQSASAVEEMTMTASEVARNSTEAAKIAEETSQTAKSGFEVMSRTVAGMQQVSEAVGQSANIITALGRSSDQIGEIVRVIEDIADQTNLLALNAAIEAARAGEQGRGFAVVADEVRKLAERTTKATKEIGDMIRQIQQDTKSAVASMEDGTQQVMSGVELANKTGEALNRIQTMVQQTTSMIQQIAQAAEEQSTATKQIAGDLEAVAQVTRDTSSGASESAKASQELNALAAKLQGLVSSFKV
ncbi:MAG: methyl-accepting chemotaxis protein [Nitrospirae bacterium]|nr:MAG: methyl-accepting chemotaxis protein [Nitrospirota bacterium]